MRSSAALPLALGLLAATTAPAAAPSVGCATAFLREHPKVEHVYYPGFEDHPARAVTDRQARGAGGGMLSFDLGTLDAARHFCENLELMTLAESLGAVETLISVPALMTHVAVPEEHRAKLGIHQGLVRISVGLEDVEDLEAELRERLDSLP